jgi:hypothetical protein
VVALVVDEVAGEEDQRGRVFLRALDDVVEFGPPVAAEVQVGQVQNSAAVQRRRQIGNGKFDSIPLKAGEMAELNPRSAAGAVITKTDRRVWQGAAMYRRGGRCAWAAQVFSRRQPNYFFAGCSAEPIMADEGVRCGARLHA